MDLTPRLEAIAKSIDECYIIADIGSDHAYLPIYLIKSGQAQKAIASDINKGPAEISKSRIKLNGLEGYIEVRIGDGLKVLDNGEADIIVVAGMGGLTMRDMLSESIDIARGAKRIILQPMRDSRTLIRWLVENDFQVINGEIIKENNKFYEIIWACYKENSYYDRNVKIINESMYYKNTPVLHEYINSKIDEYTKVLEDLKAYNTPNILKRIEECNKELEDYRKVMSWLSLNVEQ
ncbi:MAG: class I SAM-dependent methyltransferase [Lutispora sp.]|nr:class I SAM-dependent methyltransferase [Lutispora sp.]MDD4833312.1 class I SAM-dependent methyltransferase [Lutispora sp.]